MSILGEWSENIAYKMVYLLPQVGMTMEGVEDEDGPKESAGEGAESVYKFVNGIRTVVPKTRVASDQLRQLIKVGDGRDIVSVLSGVEAEGDANEAEASERFQRRHPIWVDICTSFGFELVFVGLAAFVFCHEIFDPCSLGFTSGFKG